MPFGTRRDHTPQELSAWRALGSGEGRHELPSSELPAGPGRLYFFEDIDNKNSGWYSRTMRSLTST